MLSYSNLTEKQKDQENKKGVRIYERAKEEAKTIDKDGSEIEVNI